MKRAFLVSLVAATLGLASGWAAEIQATNLDNTILALALSAAYTNEGFVVVRPKAELDTVNRSEAAQYIKDSLSSGPGGDTAAIIGTLVDQLFERNKGSGTRQAVRLTLASCVTNGYVVDHDEKYALQSHKGMESTLSGRSPEGIGSQPVYWV